MSIFGPAGDFTLGPDPTPVVFIAGGIGITPFRSMLLDAAARGLPHRITLIYSNRTPEGAPYHEELAGLARTHAAFRYVPTMVEPDKSAQPWNGERRFVNAEFLHDYVGDMTVPIFYLAGPPGLVVAATKTVLEAGAAPAHVLSEEFSGYESRPIAARARQTAVAAASFVKVARHGDLAPGQVKAVAVNGAQIALCNVDGVYYAIDDTCPHRSALAGGGRPDRQGDHLPAARRDLRRDDRRGAGRSGRRGCHMLRRPPLAGDDIEVEVRICAFLNPFTEVVL